MSKPWTDLMEKTIEKVEIKKAGRSHSGKIVELVNAESKASGAVLEITEAEVLDWISNGNSIIGYKERIIAHEAIHLWKSSGWGELRSAVVDEQFRGRGIGSEITRLLVEKYFSENPNGTIVAIKRNTEKGVTLLLKLGFEETPLSKLPNELFTKRIPEGRKAYVLRGSEYRKAQDGALHLDKIRMVAFRASAEKPIGMLVEAAKKTSEKDNMIILLDYRKDIVMRLGPAVLNALLRKEEGEMRSNSFQVEVLLFVAGTMQISKAMEKAGARNGMDFIIMGKDSDSVVAFAGANKVRLLEEVEIRLDTETTLKVAGSQFTDSH